MSFPAISFRRLAAVTLLVCLIGVVITASSRPRIQERHALFRIRPAHSYFGDSRELMSLPPAMHPIKSSYVISAALGMPGVSDLPWIASRAATKSEAEWLKGQIQVRHLNSGDDQVLRISMEGDDPAQLAVLVNAVTNAYLERVVGEEQRLLGEKWRLLEDAYQTKNKDVTRRRELVQRTMSRERDQLDIKSEELPRRMEDLAKAMRTANKLRLVLEQFDVEMRSPPHVTLLREASVPATPLTK